MAATDLAFYTTQQLVDELMRRKTFLGVVVHAEDGLKSAWSGEKIFKVHINQNLAAPHASRLLGIVAEHMEQQQ